ncbi:hypothetical protein ACFX19_002449 [Malus domestica]
MKLLHYLFLMASGEEGFLRTNLLCSTPPHLRTDLRSGGVFLKNNWGLDGGEVPANGKDVQSTPYPFVRIWTPMSEQKWEERGHVRVCDNVED